MNNTDPTTRDFQPPPLDRPFQAVPSGRLIRRPPPLITRCPCGCLVFVDVARVAGVGLSAYWTAETEWCPACRFELRIAVRVSNWSADGYPDFAFVTLVERDRRAVPAGAIERRRPRP